MKKELQVLFQLAARHFLKQYKEAGGAQSRLAEELGITQSYLSSVTTGSRTASLDLYSNIAEKLYGPLDKFLSVGRRIKEGQEPLEKKKSSPEDSVESLIARLTHYVVDHQRIEKELLETRNFYADIVHNLQSGVLVTDKDDNICFANRFMAVIAGIPQENLLNINIASLGDEFPAMELTEFIREYEKAGKSLQPHFYENIRVVTANARKIYLSGWMIPKSKDDIFQGMTCTIRDTSKSEELTMLLGMTLDNSPYAIGITKQVKPGVYEPTYFTNKKMRRLFGQEAAEYDDISIHESLVRCKEFIVNYKEWLDFLGKHSAEGTKGSLIIEHTNRRKYRWTTESLLDSDGRPWGRMAVVKEVRMQGK